MNRWTAIVLIVCAAAVAAAQWVVPMDVGRILAALLVVLVTLTILSQHRALTATIHSLGAAHDEQIESERRYHMIFAACSDAIFIWHMQDDGRPGPFEEVNAAACTTLGYSREKLMGMAVHDIYAPAVRSELLGRWQELRQAGSLVFETAHLTSRGQPLFVEVNARIVEIRGRRLCLAIARNVAARKEQEELLRGISNQDELTGLLNRRGFFAMADEAQQRAVRQGVQVLLMYADVDGLKRVNDQMGHAAGDVLIVAAANVLRVTFRETDLLARLGGDEFIAMAILGHSTDEQLDRQTILARFQGAVAAKRAELGDAYDFSLSCGTIITTADDLRHIDDLLARADREMYEAKRARRRTQTGSAA